MTIPAHDTVVFSTGKELETLAKKAQTGEAHGWLENKQFMRRAQEQLDHFSQRLTTARKSWDDGVDNLGEAYETARYKLDLLRRGGSEAWGDVRKGLENALGELRRAFGKASDRF
jgi:DNA-binding protein HU-beta